MGPAPDPGDPAPSPGGAEEGTAPAHPGTVDPSPGTLHPPHPGTIYLPPLPLLGSPDPLAEVVRDVDHEDLHV
ncbi:MAG: hypothetical protein ABSA40_01130 [Candidatus Dormibacteria bacterium]|jgi:hypothetical protein